MWALMMAFAAGASAEKAKKAMVCTTFKTDIRCEGCANKVMNNVAALGKGVKDVQIDVPSKEISVTYDASKNNPENIIRGFKTIAVKAEEKK